MEGTGTNLVAEGVPNDGKADSAAPLQKVLNAAKPGTSFLLPAGTYPFSSAVVVPAGLTLSAAPTARLTVGRDGLSAFFHIGGDKVTLAGLTMEGNNLAEVGVDATVRPTSRLTVKNCILQQMAAAGIKVGYDGPTPATDVNILSNTLGACSYPISCLYNCRGVNIIGNVARSSAVRGVMLNWGGRAPGPRNILVKNNVIESYEHTAAFSMEGANDVRVLDNQFIPWHGIYGFYAAFALPPGEPLSVLIHGNSFHQMTPSTGFGGILSAASGIRLMGNTFRGFYGGLGADSNTSGGVVTGNTFTGLTQQFEGTWVHAKGWTWSGNVGIGTPPFAS